MANAVFTIDPNGTPEVKTLALNKWKVRRVFTRARYKYRNGGNDSYYISYGYRFELEWPFMHQAEYDGLKDIITAISIDKKDVRLDSLNDKDYNVTVDIDSDEFPEDDGEVFEKRPVEVVFVTKQAQTA